MPDQRAVPDQRAGRDQRAGPDRLPDRPADRPPDPPPAPAAAGAVVVEGLTWRPYGRAAVVLDDLSFAIPAGRRVLLAGASGSGKSTLLRALAGVLESAGAGETAGTVQVDRADPAAAPGVVGLVLQEPGSAVVASSLERDVAFGLENLQTPPEDMAGAVSAALRAVGLTMPADSSTLALSGGEQQRLALAGALVMRPAVLLLDEPTAMLDDESAQVVRSVVDAVVRERGLTLVVAEHRLGEWVDLVDDILVLGARGELLAYGPVHEVLATRGPHLLAEGVWVPGAPDPLPAHLDVLDGIPTGGMPPPGAATMTAEQVTVVHRTRTLHGTPRTTTALDAVSVAVCAGRTTALVGPSGSGKSSLLGALAGLFRPTAGTVTAHPDLAPEPTRTDATRTDPAAWSSVDLASAVAWVPQNATRSFVADTARGELLATSVALGRADEALGARADAVLDALGLSASADVDPRRLSGGEQRRLAIAAALLHAPALVLADEPTVGQDRQTWSVVMGLLDAARRGGAAVAMSTHDAVVVQSADAVLVLPGGRRDIAQPVVARTLVERVGPLASLAAVLLLLPLPALVHSVRQALAALAVEALWAVVALSAPGPGVSPRGRVRRLFARLGAPALGAVFVGWSSWLLGSHDLTVALVAALRVLALVAPGAVVLPYVDPDALGDQLCRWLRLPARPVVAAGAVLGRFQALSVLWAEISASRRVRGLAKGQGWAARFGGLAATTLALLTGALASATTLAVAMDARGFASVRRRTWLHPAVWRPADLVALVAGLSVVLTAAVL